MQIGQVIRKCRREKQLTQEEVAVYLGVTAPAVNKWENGNSYPDIFLLAPIARLLGIHTDTLLSYREELTDKEIDQIIRTIDSRIKQEEYHTVFQWAEERIQEYPNCTRLILGAAQILDSFRTFAALTEPEQYDEKILALYMRALNSTDYEIVQTAATSVFYFYINKKEYGKAEEYLNRIPKGKCNRERLQALLYQMQEKTEEAYKLYEQLLLTGNSDISWALNGIYTLAMKENNMEKAEAIVEKQKKLAALMEMGKYMEVSPGLGMAIHKQDKEATIQILSDLIHSIKDIASFRKSELYSHLDSSIVSSENAIFMMQKGFEADDSINFIKEDIRFKELQEQMDRLSGR